VQLADNPFYGSDQWIAYHGYDSDRIWLGLEHPDGSADHRVETGLPGDNILPDWSPDGARLAFGTRGSGNEVLYEYDLNTETTRQLVACERPCLTDGDPAYSPDGQQVAFERGLGPLVNGVPSDCGIWVSDLKTGHVRQLTSQTNPPCDPHEYSLDWAPDGRRLVYHRELPLPSGKVTTAIYTIAVDGSGERRLTPPGLVAGEPAYSPDGEWIVFNTYTPDSNVDGDDSQLYRMHPDGTGIEQLTDFEKVRAFTPSYSPDGNWIVFSAETHAGPDTTIDLWAIPASGGTPVVIDDREVARTHGTWQPAH
jgi:Tol biopolymer transport system component